MDSTPKKHPAIRRFVGELTRRFGQEAVSVVDHWDCDSVAIGLARPDDHSVLAYVASYTESSFYVELELAPEPGSDLPYAVAGRYESLAFEDALAKVAGHLGL